MIACNTCVLVHERNESVDLRRRGTSKKSIQTLSIDDDHAERRDLPRSPSHSTRPCRSSSFPRRGGARVLGARTRPSPRFVEVPLTRCASASSSSSMTMFVRMTSHHTHSHHTDVYRPSRRVSRGLAGSSDAFFALDTFLDATQGSELSVVRGPRPATDPDRTRPRTRRTAAP